MSFVAIPQPELPNTSWGIATNDIVGYLRFGDGGGALFHVGQEDQIIRYSYEYDFPVVKFYPDDESFSQITGTFNNGALSLINETKSKTIGTFTQLETAPTALSSDSNKVAEFLISLRNITTYLIRNSLQQFGHAGYLITNMRVIEYDGMLKQLNERTITNSLDFGDATEQFTADDHAVILYVGITYDYNGTEITFSGSSAETLLGLKQGVHNDLNLRFTAF